MAMKNFIIKLFLNSLAVLLASYLLRNHIFITGYASAIPDWLARWDNATGMHWENFGYIILIALTLSILNVSVKPLLVLFTLPATILSLGLFLLVINTAIIEIAAYLLRPHFIVQSWWWAFLFSILLSILNSILEKLLKLPNRAISVEKDVKIYDKDGNRIA